MIYGSSKSFSSISESKGSRSSSSGCSGSGGSGGGGGGGDISSSSSSSDSSGSSSSSGSDSCSYSVVVVLVADDEAIATFTNTGSVPITFNSFDHPDASFSPLSLTLNPGESGNVNILATGIDIRGTNITFYTTCAPGVLQYAIIPNA